MAHKHPATVYYRIEDWCKSFCDTDAAQRLAVRIWKGHIARNGNVPLTKKCEICSGKAHKRDVKRGRWNLSRPKKSVRDEDKMVTVLV